MKKNALMRLKALLLITAANITAAEKSELDILTKAAKDAKIDTKAIDEAIEKAEPDDDDDDSEEMSEDEVKDVVTKAVKEAMADHKSATTDEIADAVMAKVKAAQAADTKGLTEDKVRSIMGEVMKENQKSPSKMEHPVNDSPEFPVEHRAGNLSVAQKQLLNVCLMKVSEDALAEHGTKRPRDINDGLTDSIIRRSKTVSAGVMAGVKKFQGKGLTTTGSGSGAELVYTDLSTELQTRLYLQSELAQVLQSRELNMPTDPFKLPIKTVRTSFTVGSESPTPGSLGAYLHYNNPTLANITLDAKKIIGIASYSYEANEDSVIAILPMLQNDMADGAVAAYEDAIINGDVGANTAHQDYVASPLYPATDSVVLLYDGIRKMGLATGVVDWTTNGLCRANFMSLRGLMGKWGTNPNDLAIIVSPQGYCQLQGIDDAFRADYRGGANYGAIAAVNTGVISTFNGIRVITSEWMPSGVADTGVFDGSGTHQTFIIANLTQYIVGVRRGFTVEVTSDPLIQTNYVVASFRRAFVPKETASASIPHTVLATEWQ